MKRILVILITACLGLLPAAPAGAVVLTPLVDPSTTNPYSDMYVPDFSAGEQDALAAAGNAFTRSIDQLKQLEKKYPGMGFENLSGELQQKYVSYKKASRTKGTTLWGDTPAYVSPDNYLCFTDMFFNNRYSTEERMGIIIHEMAHLDQYRFYRYGSNFINGLSLGFIAMPSESDSNIAEYKWLKILGKGNSFEMQNVLKALVEQGIIANVHDTDSLDQRLGIQALSRITAQGLETALNGEIKGGDEKPFVTQITLNPAYPYSVPAAFSGLKLNTNPAKVPAKAQVNFAFAIPGPGDLDIKARFASSAPVDAPRFLGDTLGYRKQAYLVLKIQENSNIYDFKNGYNNDFNELTIARHFNAGAAVQVTVVPQGVTAGISPVSGELLPMSDGAGYIYYGGACFLEFTFSPATESSRSPGPPSGPDISILINGSALQTDTPPTILNGRTLVPVAAIFQALGAMVSWDESTRTVVGLKGFTEIKLQIDNTEARINGEIVKLDVPATIINGRTMVPAGFIALSLGKKVEWDGESRTVIIKD